ncbi:MAG: undecaprenyl-phosphate N-acetylglucosaminyl 1-phosphate transferase [Candidatus Berkelbacteria bacterium]|nr:undecaprenyl-phosphate N-acetylglucosaminyl 1-phosphate transferase [Candidatus Berkelbacteria bacterium]
MIRAYLPPLIISALICGGLTYYVKILAEKLKFFDLPGPRKVHPKPIPRLGGVAIVVSFLIVTIGYTLASHRLNFSGFQLIFLDKRLAGVLIGLLILLIGGVVDDIRGIKPWKKLIWQIVAAGTVVVFGLGINYLRLPFGEHIQLNNWQIPITIFNFHYTFVVWGDLLTIFWIVLLINTFNFLDGLDGLASGISVITAIVILVLSILLGQDANALLAALIAGVTLGFLPWNFNPAKIFLGDSGSQSLGFLIGVLSIISGGKLATAFLVLGLPVLDVGWVVLRRILTGVSPFSADKKHLHHRLLTAGLSQKQAVIILYILSMVFGSVAVLASTKGKVTAVLVLLILMAALAITLIVLEYRKRTKQDFQMK